MVFAVLDVTNGLNVIKVLRFLSASLYFSKRGAY